jgi:hypothetical protein
MIIQSVMLFLHASLPLACTACMHCSCMGAGETQKFKPRAHESFTSLDKAYKITVATIVHALC